MDNGFRHLAGTNKMYICHERQRLIESDIQSFILLDKETNILLFNKSASLYINKLTGVNLSSGLNLKSIVPENISESFLKNLRWTKKSCFSGKV